MSDLSEFHQRAAAVAVNKMLTGRHFSICDLDTLGKLLGRTQHLAGVDYQALHALHCVDWGDMDPDLRRMVREKCLELLGLPPHVVDMPEARSAEPKGAEPAKQRGILERLGISIGGGAR